MTIVTRKACFSCDMKKVWDIVTSLENYAWRSDVHKIEVLDEQRFIEYSKSGYKTYFETTVLEPYKRWEFDIENENMSGHWTGIFSQNKDIIEIQFTEAVNPKKFFMKPLIKTYLKKQQSNYILDLEKAINEFIDDK